MGIVHTKNLTKQFDAVKAVSNVSIGFVKGQVTGIVGPNGSGKTTLVNLLTGMVPITSGIVVISDIKLGQIKPYQIATYGVTRTFQQVRVFEQMTVLDNILVVLTERDIFSSLFEQHTELHLAQAKQILQRVDLWKKKDEQAENLSYGQRKLLEIARALSMQSEIVLFDEPFAGLFPKMREIVSDAIHQLRDTGKTVLLIEHEMETITELCDHLIVLDAGELLAQGKPTKVLQMQKVKEAYLGL